jgi:hypothetical protein
MAETPQWAWQGWRPQENAFRYLAILCAALVLMPVARLAGQEAQSGVDVRATISSEAIYAPELTEGPRNGTPLDGAFRAVVYPMVKLSEHWIDQIGHPECAVNGDAIARLSFSFSDSNAAGAMSSENRRRSRSGP